MSKKERVKKARAKPKNVIQKVIVNVGARGGRASKSTKQGEPLAAISGPPRPTPLQTALEFARSFQPPRPVEPAIPPAQVLQRLLEPIQMRLDTLMQRQPSMNLPINITQPPINIRQPEIFVAPPNVSVNQQFSTFHMSHNRQHVVDLPDAPLVEPNAPLVPAGPMRMDDPHEDVPLIKVDPALVQGKQEAREPLLVEEKIYASESDREETQEPARAGVRSPMDNIPLTYEALDKLPLKRKANTPLTTATLTEFASYLGLPLPRNVLAMGKSGVVDYILQNRKR